MKTLAVLSMLLFSQLSLGMDAPYTVTSKTVRFPDSELNIVILDGVLNTGVADETIKAIRGSGAKQIYLELNSKGGFFNEAEKIFDEIKTLKKEGYEVDTFVPSGSVCASACTLIFLAGERRIAGEAAAFMVHAVQRESMPGFVNSLYTSHILSMYIDAGIPAAWINDLRVKGVFSQVNDFWFSGRDAASKEIGLATQMTSGLIENNPPPIDPQIGRH